MGRMVCFHFAMMAIVTLNLKKKTLLVQVPEKIGRKSFERVDGGDQ